MRNIRYLFRLLIEFVARFKGLIILSTIIGIVFFVLVSVLAPKILQNKVEVIGISGRFQADTLPSEILTMISDGLTVVDESGIPNPSLASSWETSDKGKTWTFHLREGIFWQDNKKMVSSDIKYNFSDVKIDYPDPKTIVFELNDPYIPFPTIISVPVFKNGLLGTGKWKVNNLSLSRNNVQKISLSKGKEKILYKFYPTDEQLKLAYKMGEIAKIENISDPKPFDSWNNSNLEKISNFGQETVIFFNTQDSILSEKTLRQALNYAIDKESFGYERAISPININSFAYNSQVKQYTYDTVRAKELINSLSSDQKKNLSIKLVSTPSLLSTAETISKFWKEIGIDTQVLVTSIVPTDYQAYLTNFDIPKDPDQYFLWHSTQVSTNITKYKNPRIDKLLEDGRQEVSLEERKKIYLDFQRFLMEDSPAVFLYYPVTYNIIRK